LLRGMSNLIADYCLLALGRATRERLIGPADQRTIRLLQEIMSDVEELTALTDGIVRPPVKPPTRRLHHGTDNDLSARPSWAACRP
jgi:hypothetical protein